MLYIIRAPMQKLMHVLDIGEGTFLGGDSKDCEVVHVVMIANLMNHFWSYLKHFSGI